MAQAGVGLVIETDEGSGVISVVDTVEGGPAASCGKIEVRFISDAKQGEREGEREREHEKYHRSLLFIDERAHGLALSALFSPPPSTTFSPIELPSP
jgi:hypothetical protein